MDDPPAEGVVGEAAAVESTDAGTATSGRASVRVGSGIALSRLSGLVREAAVARFLGADAAADAFKAALQIPNLIQNMLGEGVLSAAFIPVLSRIVDRDDPEEEGRVAGTVASLLTAMAMLLGAGMVIGAPWVVRAVAPGFSDAPATFSLTVTLTRIMTLGVILQVGGAWCLGVLNSHRRFFLSYVAPVVWNASQIVVVVTLGLAGWRGGDLATALAWGLVAGALLQVAVQLPTVLRLLPHLRFRPHVDLPEVRQVIRRTGPAVLGRGAVQISGFADLVIASLAGVGAVASIAYGQLLYLLPISLFAMSIAAAELPELSTARTDEELQRRLRIGLGRISFFLVFIATAYVLAGNQVVGLLYEGGQLGSDEARVVWFVIAAYSLGLLAAGESRLLQNTLYARDDVRGPARIAFARVVVAAGLGYVLMTQFDRLTLSGTDISGFGDLPAPLTPLSPGERGIDDVKHLGAVGLALGAAAGARFELLLLRRRFLDILGWAPSTWRVNRRLLPAALVSGAEMVALWVALPDLTELVRVPLVLGAGAVTYLAATLFVNLPQAEEMVSNLRRLWNRIASARDGGH